MQPVQATSSWAEVRGPREDAQSAQPSLGGPTTLYRKYRPTSFDAAELVGQDHIVRTLRNAVALQRVAHAYLFYGPRGTGKTTTARVLAKAMNCLHEDVEQRPCNACVNCVAINTGSTPDIIEIDAASNRGIDDIRELRDRVRFAPAQLATKVYIIDEAHQITGAAANAFLKTLEEPPGHSVFILATTDPEELLPTIVSRCQRYEFRRIDAVSMRQRLQAVADAELIAINEEALELIARQATGSLRDGLGLLERLSVQANAPGSPRVSIDAEMVRESLGLSHSERIDSLLEALADRRTGDALNIVQKAVDDGEDPRQLNRQMVDAVRELMLERAQSPRPKSESGSTALDRLSLLELANLARRFSEIDFTIRHSPYPNLPIEIAIVELTTEPPSGMLVSAQPTHDKSPEPPNPQEPPKNEAETPAPARPYSLRDRVRDPDGFREARPASTAPERSEPRQSRPAPITPIRPEPGVTVDLEAEGESHPDVGVDYIADLWPSVRADVKAINRRIEALLSEVDPVAISGSQITLAVPYAFHRDKLNTDDVRETVSSVLSRLLGRTMTFSCVLRGEIQAQGLASTPAPNYPMAESHRSGAARELEREPAPATAPDVDPLESTVRAALNIFDAEEIEATDDLAPDEGQS
jgi:DNA polymerase-3 subunit gamma/tau